MTKYICRNCEKTFEVADDEQSPLKCVHCGSANIVGAKIPSCAVEGK